MQSKSALLVTTTLLILFNAPLYAVNLEREKRMALEIADSIFMGVTIIPRSVVLLLGAGNRFDRRGILYPGKAWLMMQIIISPIEVTISWTQ